MTTQQEAKISLGVHRVKARNVFERFFLWCAGLFGDGLPAPIRVIVSADGLDLTLLVWRLDGIAAIKINDNKTIFTTCIEPVEVASIEYQTEKA